MVTTNSPKFLQHPKVRFINGLQIGDVIRFVTTEGAEIMVITDLRYSRIAVNVPDSYEKCEYSEKSDWNQWEQYRTVHPIYSAIRTVSSIQTVRAKHSVKWSFTRPDGTIKSEESFPYRRWYRSDIFYRISPCNIEELSGALIDNIDLIRDAMGLSSIRSK
jgi:hypothetical protein